MGALLSIEDLTLSFRNGNNLQRALHGISLQVHQGQTVALVGESGSGKSITALSVLQLLSPATTVYETGRILLQRRNGSTTNLLQASPATLQAVRGNEVGMIFQEPMTSLNPVITCGQQVTEVLQQHLGLTQKQARQRALQLFEQVRLPRASSLLSSYPHQLSGGQKQRVMIAMAMSCNPGLLIADEPTTALDVTVQKNVLELMQELQQQTGMGLLFITHDLGIVAEIAHRVAVMYQGSIVEEGDAATVLRAPQHPYTRALLECRPALHPRGKPLPVVSDFLNPGSAAATAKNTPLSAVVAPGKKEPLLSVHNLTVQFGSRRTLLQRKQPAVTAVNNVSFDIYEGETVGLVGESGCGKTTLGRTLLRLIEPNSGTIHIGGNNITQLSAAAMRHQRQHLQIVFQDPYSSLNPRLRIGEAIMEPMLLHRRAANRNEAREKAAYLLQQVGLGTRQLHRYPHEFSGGQRQRIVIARALALEPRFIVWDESVSALDVSVQAQVLNLLNELKAAYRFTSLFISHDLAVVHYISDRILVMQQGSIVETGDADALWNQPQHPYTRQLLDAIPGSRKFIA
ncbi:MAG: ABC transporter ATP-binding protein [Lacibacter sp.]